MSDAAAVARASAERAGLDIRLLHDVAELRAASDVFATIWGAAPISTDVLRALAHTESYVAGAFDGGRVVGASVGFLFRRPDGSIALHSHISGLLPEARDGDRGFALKQHQRAWALARDIDVVTWTFDPLVRRNAYFNITKLGADITGFEPDFYGPMDDAINDGDESDRCVATWRLRSERATLASERRWAPPDETALRDGRALTALEPDDADAPVIHDAGGPCRLAWIPRDIVDLRRRDPALAMGWRLALRSTLSSAMRDGLVATGMTRSGWYVLEDQGAATST